MKSCDYCGKENQDSAAACAECGMDAFKSTSALSVKQAVAEGSPPAIRLRSILSAPVHLFRALVILSTITYLGWFFQLLLGSAFISLETWDALAWHGFGAVLTIPPSFGWLFLLLNIAVSVGLWSFSRSARWVFTALHLFWIFTTLLSGVQVQTAFGSYLVLLQSMADGAILVMAYTLPLKAKFEDVPSNPP